MIGRSGIHALMVAAKTKAFEAVIVESFDRVSRSQADLAFIYEQLRFLGIDLIEVSEGKADPVRIGVRGIIGSTYLTNLAEETKRGLKGHDLGKVTQAARSLGAARQINL